MRWGIVFFIIVIMMLTGCEMIREDFTPTGSVVAQEDIMAMCSSEVMVCPDGSYVGRDSSNDCAFKKCPTDGYGDTSDGWGN